MPFSFRGVILAALGAGLLGGMLVVGAVWLMTR